jgi:hypothetical protein
MKWYLAKRRRRRLTKKKHPLQLKDNLKILLCPRFVMIKLELKKRIISKENRLIRKYDIGNLIVIMLFYDRKNLVLELIKWPILVYLYFSRQVRISKQLEGHSSPILFIRVSMCMEKSGNGQVHLPEQYLDSCILMRTTVLEIKKLLVNRNNCSRDS